MYQNIFYAIAVLFFAVGVCAVFVLILLRLVSPDKNSRYFIVSVFSEKDSDCAVKISCAESVITLFGLSDRCTLIAADSGLSEKERKKLPLKGPREKSLFSFLSRFFSHQHPGMEH